MILDVQFNAATTPWPVIRDAARAAEATGFGAVWVFDHLAGAPLSGSTNLELFTLLGALAATTERIALGSSVANVHNRQPATLAVGAASIEAIGDHRQVLLGVGAGASPTSRWADEQHAVGQRVEPDVTARHAQVERVVALCRTMWSPDRGDELATFPLPHTRPQIHVGVSGVALARLAGRIADGINVAWTSRRRQELFDAAVGERRSAHGSMGDFVRTTWAVWNDELLDPGSTPRGEMARAGIDRLILLVPHDVPRQLADGSAFQARPVTPRS